MAVRNVLHVVNSGKSTLSYFHQSLQLQEHFRKKVLAQCVDNSGKNGTHSLKLSSSTPILYGNVSSEAKVTTAVTTSISSLGNRTPHDDSVANSSFVRNDLPSLNSANQKGSHIEGNRHNIQNHNYTNITNNACGNGNSFNGNHGHPTTKKRNSGAKKKVAESHEHQSETVINQFLMFVEHQPVYTMGLRDHALTPKDIDRLEALGADVHRTNRGGLVTFHGPGQLVVYPIINLKAFNIGLREYISRLERVLVDTCGLVGVEANSSGPTGTWVGDKKVASIGVNARRHVTLHGVALNCCTDLSWFDHITPCGLEGVRMTNLSEHAGRQVDVKEAEWHFLSCFIKVFDCSSLSSSHYESRA